MRPFPILLFLFLLGACVSRPWSIPEKSDIRGIVSPVYLGGDTVKLVLGDYFQDIGEIKRISLPEGVEIAAGNPPVALEIFAKSPLTAVENIRINCGKYDYDIPVLCRDLAREPAARLQITTHHWEKDTLYLQSSRPKVSWSVYWQNHKLGKSFCKVSGNYLKIILPEEMSVLPQSMLRVWAFDEAGISNDVCIPLEKGRVVMDVSDIDAFVSEDTISQGDGGTFMNRREPELYEIAASSLKVPGKSFEFLNSSLEESFEKYGVHDLLPFGKGKTDRENILPFAAGKQPSTGLFSFRFASLKDYDKLTQLLVFNATLPGICNYSGVISHLAALPDSNRLIASDSLAAARRTLLLRNFALNYLRCENIALRYGDFIPLRVEKEVYAYLRSYFGKNVVIVFNKGKEPMTLKLDLPRMERELPFLSLWGNRFSYDNSKMILDIPAYGVEVIYN